jgi:protein-disulfide isomerase
MHKQAKAGAIAAVAANAQGKGLVFHERIFEQPRNLAEADLLAMARESKLKLKTFEKNRKRSSETVAKDMSDAKSLGATGTPTSFLNGRRITGAKSLSTFITITEQELIRARAAQDKHGLKGHPLYKFLTTP